VPLPDLDLVIFDCDGVLIDSEIIVCRIHADALSEAGYPITADDVLRRFTGMSDASMYGAIEREWGRSLPAGHDARVRERVAAAYRSDLAAIPGVADAIDRVARAGLRRCVASSSTPDKIRFGLELVGLYGRFDPRHVFSATMVARGKPAPDLFLFAAEWMGAMPARCVVIEDSVAGVQAARAAGMRVLGFHGGGHCGPGHAGRLLAAGAAAAFADMAEVPGLLAAG
jgi:HAD superfamily hydrolase (TIGR01509 family)